MQRAACRGKRKTLAREKQTKDEQSRRGASTKALEHSIGRGGEGGEGAADLIHTVHTLYSSRRRPAGSLCAGGGVQLTTSSAWLSLNARTA